MLNAVCLVRTDSACLLLSPVVGLAARRRQFEVEFAARGWEAEPPEGVTRGGGGAADAGRPSEGVARGADTEHGDRPSSVPRRRDALLGRGVPEGIHRRTWPHAASGTRVVGVVLYIHITEAISTEPIDQSLLMTVRNAIVDGSNGTITVHI